LDDGSPSNEDIPCNICSFVKIRNGALEWTQLLRSNDLFLGVPHNFVQFTSLQEILAGWLDVEIGSYTHWADCLHVYDRDLQVVHSTRETMGKPNIDDLRLPQEDSQSLFLEFSREMDVLRGSHLTQRSLRRISFARHYPEPLRNWMLVVAADCARRRKWLDLSFEVMSDCTNPALVELWDNWFSRWWSARQEEIVSTEAVLQAQPLLPLQFAFG
jgi:thymidylate synthase